VTNIEFIRQFEADGVPENSFHHADHVRLAFSYLSEFPPLEALEKFCAALKRFATARGKPQLYHGANRVDIQTSGRMNNHAEADRISARFRTCTESVSIALEFIYGMLTVLLVSRQ